MGGAGLPDTTQDSRVCSGAGCRRELNRFGSWFHLGKDRESGGACFFVFRACW